MRRLTTPIHTFRLPPEISTEQIEKIKIVYAQDKKVVLRRMTDSIKLGNGAAVVHLTQKETKMFSSNVGTVSMQLHIITTAGESLISQIMTDSVLAVLDEEEL